MRVRFISTGPFLNKFNGTKRRIKYSPRRTQGYTESLPRDHSVLPVHPVVKNSRFKIQEIPY